MNFSHINNVDELKAEYKKLAFKLHPDKEGGDKDSFIRMQLAYQKRLKELTEPKTEPENILPNIDFSELEKKTKEFANSFIDKQLKKVKIDNKYKLMIKLITKQEIDKLDLNKLINNLINKVK